MNKSEWINYNNRIINGISEPSEDDFRNYQDNRIKQLMEIANNDLSASVTAGDFDNVAEFVFRLSKMVATDEAAILRLRTVASEAQRVHDLSGLSSCFQLFIDSVIGHGDNPALSRFKDQDKW